MKNNEDIKLHPLFIFLALYPGVDSLSDTIESEWRGLNKDFQNRSKFISSDGDKTHLCKRRNYRKNKRHVKDK